MKFLEAGIKTDEKLVSTVQSLSKHLGQDVRAARIYDTLKHYLTSYQARLKRIKLQLVRKQMRGVQKHSLQKS